MPGGGTTAALDQAANLEDEHNGVVFAVFVPAGRLG